MRKSIFNAGLFFFVIVLMSPWIASRDVQAAGLGKLTVNSALGQPFKAEIDLVAVKKEEVSSLVAKIASRDAFRQANVDYSILLSSFKVSVETRADGQPYVKITSSRPVTDPFVSMLVELTWSSGRLLREYTVLLDPIETEAPRLAAPRIQTAPSAPAPAAAPAQPATEAPVAAPVKDAVVESKPEAPAPAPVAREATAVADKSGTTGATYGPVKRGDTLAKIAREVAPQGVNLDQMLVALHRANRDAFSGNNMNRLKTGPILRVPDSNEIATVAPAEAKKEVKVQAADWNSYRQKLAALAGAAPVAAETPKQEASGKITTTVQDKAAANKEASKDVLKLSKGEEPGAGGKDSKDAKAMQARIRAMEEDATAKGKALKESNERVALLEKNVKEMQRLLELKNTAIAEAQKQALAAAKSSAAPAAATPPAPPVVAAAPTPAATPAEPAKPETIPPTQAETAAKAEAKPDAAVVAGASAVEAADSAKPAAEAEAKPAKPAVSPPPPVAEPSLLDELMDYIEYVAGALVLLLAGAGAFVFWKKKKSAKSGGVMAPVVAQQTHEAVSLASSGTETSFASQAVDEVDPLAEAEVYLAYGRDTQAEEILKEALAKNPANAECLAKLLEVYVMRKDKKSFETTALALQAVAPEGPLWERATGLGIGIDPTNPLYGGAVAVDVNEGAASAPTPDFSLDAGTASDVAPDVDFDLGGATTTPVADPEATRYAEPDYGLKFGAKDGTEDVEATMVVSQPGHVPAPEAAPPPVEGLEDALVFDLGTPAASAPVETPVAKAAPDEDMGMAFSIDFPSSSESAPAPAKPSPEPEADLAAISFNMDDILSSPPTDAGSGTVERDAHWHEISTKFDLAKAYQEMGDNDGAKEILQEVIREGDAQQQEDAKAMLASL